MTVKFEKISAYKEVDFNLPQRSTELSAGYDFEVVEDTVIPSIYKSIFLLIKERVTQVEFLSLLSETEIIDTLVTNSTVLTTGSEEEKKEIIEGLSKHTPEFFEKIMEGMALDLDEVKDLFKQVGAGATLVPTGVKAKLEDNQKLDLMIRSSTPLKSFIIMGNGVGLIDADYYNNDSNEGHIFFQFLNLSPFDIKLKKGDVIGQGVITNYHTTSDDAAKGLREGGFGSTDS